MGNFKELIKKLEIPLNELDEKKEQTNYKIKYIVEYIRLWLIVSCGRMSKLKILILLILWQMLEYM